MRLPGGFTRTKTRVALSKAAAPTAARSRLAHWEGPMNAPFDFTAIQLALLAIRSRELADRVTAGLLPFIDAVDMAYSAAEWAGLTDTVGDDVVQSILAAAFANVREVKP
jgi:hypothetical protein